jgi:hypothetical protein
MPEPRNSRSAFPTGARNGTPAEPVAGTDAENVSPDLRRVKVGDRRKPATWRVDRELLDDFIHWCQARDYAQNAALEEFMRRGMKEMG